MDIRCYGPEQMIRYACLLLDTADENGWVFDELIQEKRGVYGDPNAGVIYLYGRRL